MNYWCGCISLARDYYLATVVVDGMEGTRLGTSGTGPERKMVGCLIRWNLFYKNVRRCVC